MERVAVLGSPGAGKSTLARRLAERTGLPLVHLDAEFWRPGWSPTPAGEWRARVHDLAARPRWIIDGNYHSTLEPRLLRADAVVWLDLPRLTCLRRALGRALAWRGRERPDMGPGCPEEVLTRSFLEFLWYVATFPERIRPTVASALARDARVVRLARPNDVEEFLAGLPSAAPAAAPR